MAERLTPRSRRLIAFAVFGVIALAALIWAFRPQPILADLATVERGAMTVELTEEAKTRIREVYVVSAPVAGRLERVDVKAGYPVFSGVTPVARIRPADPVFLDRRTAAEAENMMHAAEAARDAAAAEVRRAKAAYDQAQADFERDRRLYASGTVAQARYDTAVTRRDGARAAWDAARDGLRAREADLARAQVALIAPGGDAAEGGGLDLRAPVDGQILAIMQKSEAVIPAGAPILAIGDPRDLEIFAEMLSVDAVRITEGADVRIDGWGGEELQGRVRWVEPAAFTKISALGVEEQRVNVIIDIVSPRDQWAGLAHLFRVDVHVEVWSGEDVAKIPTAALFREEGHWAAFAVERGRVRLKALEIGRSNAREAELLGGLDEGATVVLHPSDRIKERVRVRPRG